MEVNLRQRFTWWRPSERHIYLTSDYVVLRTLSGGKFYEPDRYPNLHREFAALAKHPKEGPEFGQAAFHFVKRFGFLGLGRIGPDHDSRYVESLETLRFHASLLATLLEAAHVWLMRDVEAAERMLRRKHEFMTFWMVPKDSVALAGEDGTLFHAANEMALIWSAQVRARKKALLRFSLHGMDVYDTKRERLLAGLKDEPKPLLELWYLATEKAAEEFQKHLRVVFDPFRGIKRPILEPNNLWGCVLLKAVKDLFGTLPEGKTCEECEASFAPKRSEQKYCSKKCRDRVAARAYRKRQKKRSRP
ncbi:MAG: hypothetical protein KatS3mg007_0334 [Thermoanaerobaculum sp.]|nr:MAG: hypothetical protein KatS3mg007_0334 [Thermoanaerobaculum sp.]